MGLLRNIRTGRVVALGARLVVGRSGNCGLQLDSRVVSNEHAAIWWEADRWLVRDTGSRNGTRIDGRLLAPGERSAIPLEARLEFGHEEQSWMLIESGAPVALARSEKRTVSAEGGVVCLPSAESPAVMIFEGGAGGWVAEGPDGLVPVRDGSALAVECEAFILHLPLGDTSTWQAGAGIVTLASLALRFRVSLDEEFIEVLVESGGKRTALPSRAYHELLLALARAQLEDAGHELPERGWRYSDVIQRMIHADSTKLNVHIFRARQQFGELGVLGSGSIIERRVSTGQIRLGVAQVVVEGLGAG